jgi:hypothetical protein
MGRRDVANVVHIEAQQGAHFRFLERGLDAIQSIRAQTLKIDALFPVNAHQAEGFQSHVEPSSISRSRSPKVSINMFRTSGTIGTAVTVATQALLHNVFAISVTDSGVGTV